MGIAFRKVKNEDYGEFHALMDAYYRGGEDKDTPQDVVDSFIRMLFDKAVGETIQGCLAIAEQPVGFALWMVDQEGADFSELPGYGTILEIGVTEAHRKSGIGAQLVAHCEADVRERGAKWAYVCAYGPAQEFWRKCGYVESGSTASNGLPILIKQIDA